MMEKRVSIPDFYATVEVRTPLDRDQVAEQVGIALGVVFEEDFEGLFEELNALVTEVLKITIGLHEENSKSGENKSRRIRLVPRNTFSPTYFGLDLEQCQFARLFIAEFLAALLRSKTGLPFEAVPYVKQPDAGAPREWMVPHLRAALELETIKSLPQVAARVGAALGLSFGRTSCVGERGPYPGWWYVRTAQALEHQVVLYAAQGPYSTPLPRRMVLTLQPVLNLADLGLEESQWEVVELSIDEYLAAILRRETDLPFRPMALASS